MRRHKLKLVLRYNHLQTAPKLPEIFCYRNVRPCETVSVNCPSEPEKFHCLDIIQINEAFEAT